MTQIRYCLHIYLCCLKEVSLIDILDLIHGEVRGKLLIGKK